ncbi:MAG: hypothetical protein ACLFR1_06740 [Spirochaetia bacterium]
MDNEIKKYAEDLSIIRGILEKKEGIPYVKPWAYFTWAAIILLGTLLNTVLYNTQALSFTESAVYIWIPLFVLGIVLETIAWFMKLEDKGIPLLTKEVISFLVSLTFFTVLIGFLVPFLIKPENPVPGIILVVASIGILLFAQVIKRMFYGVAFFIGALGMVFILLNGKSQFYYIAAGVISALTFTVIGVYELIRERKKK